MIDTVKVLAADIAPDLSAESGIDGWEMLLVAAIFAAALAFLFRIYTGGRKHANTPGCSFCDGGCGHRSPNRDCKAANKRSDLHF